ncbi:MAG: twin-arginine translocase TatA/TatE family subunit [Nitrospirae bacterium]|nr:twin-arginine translocase TatA/TatE family subunit [Nitrospirota bacterium]
MFEGLFQPMHMLVVLVIALIVFGPKKLPELGAGLGKSIREFKKALSAEPEKPAVENKNADAINTTEMKSEQATPPVDDKKTV